MGLIDRLRKIGGIVKNRIASSVGALRGAARGVTVSGGRVRRGVRFAARGTRLLTPTGIALSAVAFAPEIFKGLKAARRFIAPAIARGIAFFGGRQLATAAGAGAVAGTLANRKSGGVTRPSDLGDPRLQTRLPTGQPRIGPIRPGAPRDVVRERFRAAGKRAPLRRRPRGARRPMRRGRVRRHRHRVISIPVTRRGRRGRKRTHASPRHRGHKRVSFTTASGKKVSFLVNPKARHR